MNQKEKEILETLGKLRPYLQRDGGDLEFVSFVDGVVMIKMLGACQDCVAQEDTILLGVEPLLMEEVEGIVGVKVVKE